VGKDRKKGNLIDKNDAAQGKDFKNKKENISGPKKAVLIAVSVLVLILLATGTYVLAFYTQVKETQRVLLGAVTFDEEYDVDDLFSEHIVNIALLGFDRGWNREAYGEYLFRPDMLAVLSIDFEKDLISVVRLPRDSYVPIHGMSGFHDKINHSYYYGYLYGPGEDSHAEGIRFTLQTVSKTLGGIPIHYYISVDMYSIVELVDALGGIYYEVEETIYDKHWIVGRVLVPEGPQILDGKTFLRYLQYRDDKTRQDYGRIDRQMNLLKETFYYLREQGRMTDLPVTYRIYKDYVETDLSYKQIAALAFYARDVEVSDDNLNFHTIYGEGQMKDGIWYQVIFQDDRLRIIKEIFGIDAEAWPPIILEDSPEYLEEQERKRLEEEMGLEEEESLFETGDEAAGQDEQLQGAVVPDVRGLRVEEAMIELVRSGFKPGAITGRYYRFLDEGLVIQSEPLSGSISIKGTEVNLIVSLGTEESGP